jgi:long-chain acyl-CoA synthetase
MAIRVAILQKVTAPEHLSERTAIGVFLRQAARYEAKELVRYHDGADWRPVTWTEMRDLAFRVAARLVEAGIAPGDRVAIQAENRLEWLYCDLAIQAAGAIPVPIYPTVPPGTGHQILANSEAKLVFVPDQELAERVRPYRAVQMDTELVEWVQPEPAPESRDEVYRRLEAVRPEDLYTIVYTSGTTGEPKGVMLTHGAVVDIVQSALKVFPVGEDDVELSFLPYAHVFERINGILVGIAAGASAWLSRGTANLLDDIAASQPTVMVAVPRVYEKMHQQVLAQVARSPARRQRMFRWALEQGRRHSRGRPAPFHTLADRLVLSRLRRTLTGGRLRFFISGGAPLSREVEEFFWSFGVKILNGWGMTETASGASANTLDHHRFETVGRPLPGVEFKIADDGEILVKSPGNMTGYFRNEAATAETLQDGWVLTGDIGTIEPDGSIRITDRKKDLIKTAGGKFVAPQMHEGRLQDQPEIERAVVIGDERPYVVALIVPDWRALELTQGIKGGPATLVEDERVRAIVQKRVDELNSQLGRWETIKYFKLLPDDFTEESGELTPTLKVKRRVVEQRHRDAIEAMYASRAASAQGGS